MASAHQCKDERIESSRHPSAPYILFGNSNDVTHNPIYEMKARTYLVQDGPRSNNPPDEPVMLKLKDPQHEQRGLIGEMVGKNAHES